MPNVKTAWDIALGNLTCDKDITRKPAQRDGDIKQRDWLITWVRIVCDDCKNDKVLSSLLDELEHDLLTKPFVLSNENSSGVIFGRVSLLRLVTNRLDAHYTARFPFTSIVGGELERLATPFPMANHLRDKSSCKTISDNLYIAQFIQGKMCNREAKEESTRVETERGHQEALIALSTILNRIASILPSKSVNWCPICFRRATTESEYCDIHRPPGSQYSGDRRLIERFPPDFHKAFMAGRSFRRLLNENVILVAEVSDITLSLFDSGCLIVPVEVKRLVDIVGSIDWCDAAIYWDQFLLLDVPSVRERLKLLPSHCSSWNEFVERLGVELKNPHEETVHPFWVFTWLLDAADWFDYESSHSDGRTTETRQRVVTLFRDGISTTDIAIALGISTSMVYRIKRGLGDKVTQ